MMRRVPLLASCALLALGLVGCGKGGENLWNRNFPAREPGTAPGKTAKPEVTGYWEGRVAMGGIRIKVAHDSIVLAMKCDDKGKILAEATAPISLRGDGIFLGKDLAGGDEDCGFRFNAGSAFAYRLNDASALDISFAGTSVARLTRIADLEPAR